MHIFITDHRNGRRYFQELKKNSLTLQTLYVLSISPFMNLTTEKILLREIGLGGFILQGRG